MNGIYTVVGDEKNGRYFSCRCCFYVCCCTCFIICFSYHMEHVGISKFTQKFENKKTPAIIHHLAPLLSYAPISSSKDINAQQQLLLLQHQQHQQQREAMPRSVGSVMTCFENTIIPGRSLIYVSVILLLTLKIVDYRTTSICIRRCPVQLLVPVHAGDRQNRNN